MKKRLVLLLFFIAFVAFAGNTIPLQTVAPIKQTTGDAKKAAIALDDGAVYVCPDGYDLYARALPPKSTDPKAQPPQGDFKTLWYLNANPQILRSTSEKPFWAVCIKSE